MLTKTPTTGAVAPVWSFRKLRPAEHTARETGASAGVHTSAPARRTHCPQGTGTVTKKRDLLSRSAPEGPANLPKPRLHRGRPVRGSTGSRLRCPTPACVLSSPSIWSCLHLGGRSSTSWRSSPSPLVTFARRLQWLAFIDNVLWRAPLGTRLCKLQVHRQCRGPVRPHKKYGKDPAVNGTLAAGPRFGQGMVP